MTNWRDDKAWSESDRNIGRAKMIVGPYVLQVAPIEVDRHEATDFNLRVRDLTIAVRVRRRSLGYYERFPNHFTIRYSRDNGVPTEFEKIRAGFARWMLYAHADDQVMEPWMIIDLDQFRHACNIFPNLYRAPFRPGVSGIQPNGDGTHFLWVDRTRLRPSATIATSQSREWDLFRR